MTVRLDLSYDGTDFHGYARQPDVPTVQGTLDAALSTLRFEGTVIELSWYGAATVPVQLGGPFHSQRLTIRSSQTTASKASPSWECSRRHLATGRLGIRNFSRN